MYIHNLMGYVQMYVYILVLLTDMPNGKFEQIALGKKMKFPEICDYRKCTGNV